MPLHPRYHPRLYREGGGIWDSIVRFFKGPRKQAPPSVRKFLKDNPDQIQSISVGREPLSFPVDLGLNVLTEGKFDKVRKEQGIDKVRHTYLVATLANGKKVKIEKNHVVEIKDYKPHDKEELLPVQLKKGTPQDLQSLLDNGNKRQREKKDINKGDFWKYDPYNNNCQYFVDDIVHGNDATNKNDATQFTVQENAKKTIAGYEGLMHAASNLAGRWDHAINGEGLRGKKRKRK